MIFKEILINEFNTTLILPKEYKFIEINNQWKLFYSVWNEIYQSELIFSFKENKVFPNKFRQFFKNNSVIVLLISKEKKLILQKRAYNKSWEPWKIDLASIAWQSRAIFVWWILQNENPMQTAIREISEETWIKMSKLNINKLKFIWKSYNSQTKENQNIFLYLENLSAKDLNKNILEKKTDWEVSLWLEKDYNETLKEYFWKDVEKYAWWEKMRKINFISKKWIRKNLDKFF